MKHVDLNADLAEGCGNDEALMQRISSANIACALHAGSFADMRRALVWAKRQNVRIGAHPGYPDRANFGRTDMTLPEAELRACLQYQLGALQALCDAAGVQTAYVKPHGALYNQAARNRQLAGIIADTVGRFNPQLKLMALSGSLLLEAGREAGLGVISEVFADRRYLPDGKLVPRSRPDAQIENDEEAIAQVLQMVLAGTVTAVDGSTVNVRADSICLHGDGAHALEFADKIRAALAAHNIAVQAV
ncbi:MULTISPECIES: 5-oxoprolinase subunit PxpA [unclassified Neisseria]|uniref:5-oxoprolinase subunit PxpA n=1 Tax=unclassified Neisseria TaxID=2623750 RepID=UPI00266674C4|nr:MULTISPECIES: 5-oxoprolinase subunit PxpA [unclassified Neisseria]MDO1510147.1 5-oxoprolinase subunit PxpA [Neisseria sp. MVDL19-042950]MDO1516723.1 5-oxoprolinase subunit PxpA [Neisseria sp. MVDL18-041461]MDO1563870.1 5-oxoprolinase subunit PxpA [Neisseria sp. MVDL20-010259]